MDNPKRYSEKVKRKDDENNSGLQIPAGSFNQAKTFSSFIKPHFTPHFKSHFGSGMEIKAKLEISHPLDESEMQADELADSFLSGDADRSQEILSQQVPEISRSGEGESIQTSDAFDQQLQSSKGQGQKLDEGTRSELEEHTGTDLSSVNIHTGPQAHEMSGSINAKAFAHGQDIYFREGNYNPQSEEGKSLLAHEVAHTVQAESNIHAQMEIIHCGGQDPILQSKQLVSAYFAGDTEALSVLHGETTISLGDMQGKNGINNLIEKVKAAVLLLGYSDQIVVGSGEYDTGTALAIYEIKGDNMILDSVAMEQLDFKMFEKEITANILYPTLPKRPNNPDATTGIPDMPYFYEITLKAEGKIYEKTGGLGKLIGTAPQGGVINLYEEYWGAKQKDWVYVGYGDLLGFMPGSALDFTKYKWGRNLQSVTISSHELETRESESKDFMLPIASAYVSLNGDPFQISVFEDKVFATEDFGMSDIEERTQKTLTVRFEYTGSGFTDKRYMYIDLDPKNFGITENTWVNIFAYTSDITATDTMVSIQISLKEKDPYMMPANLWQGATMQFPHKMEYDSQWSPAAHIHKFYSGSILNETGQEYLSGITVVQPWSLRVSKKKETTDEETAYADSLLTGGEAMSACITTIDEISTPLPALSPDDPFAGKILTNSMPWDLLKVQLETDLKDSKLVDKPNKNATSLFHSLGILKPTLESLLPALYPSDKKTPAALTTNAEIVRDAVELAAYTSYAHPENAKGDMDAALQKFEFVVSQMQGTQLQQGGGMHRSLNQMSQAYNYIQRAPDSGYYFSVYNLIDYNLKEQTTSYKHQRYSFFQPPGIESTAFADKGYPTITPTHLNFLVTLLGVEYSMKGFKKLEADVGDNWFYASTPEAKVMADRYDGFKNLLEEVEKSIEKPQLTVDADLARHYITFKKLFYEDASFTKAYQAFNAALDTLSKTLQENDANNEFVKGLIINVVIFIVAELLTMGMATVFAPEFFSLAAFTTFRIVSTTVLATMLSQAVQVMRFGETQVSFFEELAVNALMVGALRYVGLKFMPWMPKTTGGVILKWGTQEVTTLLAMQGFANAYYLVKTGQLMGGDEQLKTLLANSFLNYSGKLTNKVFAKPIENIYGIIGNNIVAANEPAFRYILDGLAKTRLEIAEISRSMTEKNEVDPRYAQKMDEHFDYMQKFREKMLKLAGKKDIKIIRNISDTFDADFKQFLAEQNLMMKQQRLIGNIGFGEGATDMIIMGTSQENVFLFDPKDRQVLSDHYTKQGGTFEPDNRNIYGKGKDATYIATLNGREIIYIARENIQRYGVQFRQELYRNELMNRLTAENFFDREDVQKLLKSDGKEKDVVKDIQSLLAVDEALYNLKMMTEYQDLTLLTDVQLVKLLEKGVTFEQYMAKNPSSNKDMLRMGKEPDQNIAVYESMADFDIAGFTKEMEWKLAAEVKSGDESGGKVSDKLKDRVTELQDFIDNRNMPDNKYRIVQLRPGSHEIAQDLSATVKLEKTDQIETKTIGPKKKEFDINLRMEKETLNKAAKDIYDNRKIYIK